MMDELGHPRVVLGVDFSVHGLAALRAAVAETRTRRVPLYAIRSCNSDPVTEDLTTIQAAFAEALGDIPGDLEIHATISPFTAARALTDAASDPRDLIVVGNGGKGAWGSLWSGSVIRGMIHRSRCPILTVPGPEMAREVHGRWFNRSGRDDLWKQFEQAAAQ
jgi:nucleotide-binding universal stress UspA family protein